ncbi:class I SAM-dependent methyltransferase [Umezawaea endophytica]|uniref:Methyltransferase domain-containing protein n=1 Tax=Umezawaea endophytica TaxID=1654476 RepID=A0A9X2VHS8_9PSEU|nr:class I SAM-dependent methyltransferase [Umezawaea endophytica]MCS7476905.1 methyltransferase domain-containing protein [Umezawaea endophytica]
MHSTDIATSTESADTGRYLFDNDTADAADQVQLLAAMLDGHTTSVLDELGISRDWQCLDLGAGAGTVSTWLADRLGSAGHVTVIDEKPQHVPVHDRVEVVTGDVNTTDFGRDRYDLIHARFLFMHLPQRERVMERAVAALKPGGVLVVTDCDASRRGDMLVVAPEPVVDAFTAFQDALTAIGVSNGMDPAWARRIPASMRAAGLVDVTARVFNRLWAGGEAGMLLQDSISRQIEAGLLDRGVDLPALDVLREGMHDPDVWAYSWPVYTGVGVRAA